MKKFFLFTLGLAILLFVSCASLPEFTYDVDVQYESDNPAVSLEVTPTYSSYRWFGSINSGFYKFSCMFKNNTDKTARVVWDESSLNYNGNSFVPFIDGQKYSNAQNPMSPAAISKGSMITKNVYSSAQPYYNGTAGCWNIDYIYASTVQLLFMIKSDKGEEYITATVKAIPIN